MRESLSVECIEIDEKEGTCDLVKFCLAIAYLFYPYPDFCVEDGTELGKISEL